MSKDNIEVRDLEAFIDGLQTSFDTLEHVTPENTSGVQAQLAKAISILRSKKVAKITSETPIKKMNKEQLKKLLLSELEELKLDLEAGDYNQRKKFELVMKIVKLRERISRF